MKPLLILLFPITVFSQEIDSNKLIIKEKLEYYYSKTSQVGLFSQARQKYIDSILIFDHENAYLWQQKAMPLFKQKKYELALQYLDSAIKYDKTNHYLEYGAFMKCIFVKSYKNAITDFENLKSNNKIGFVMDHSYDFYLGISYLQLNQLDKAEEHIKNSIKFSEDKWKEGHFVEYFYLGIVKMEQENLTESIEYFDKALKIYAEFPDPKYYKALLLKQQNKNEEAKQLIEQAIINLSNGFNLNEDNAIYEDYPYQIKKYWLTNEIEVINNKMKRSN